MLQAQSFEAVRLPLIKIHKRKYRNQHTTNWLMCICDSWDSEPCLTTSKINTSFFLVSCICLFFLALENLFFYQNLTPDNVNSNTLPWWILSLSFLFSLLWHAWWKWSLHPLYLLALVHNQAPYVTSYYSSGCSWGEEWQEDGKIKKRGKTWS